MDARLREAERRWRQTGAVEDEARYLVHRVHLGVLAPARLGAAAHCGHPAAREAADALGFPCAAPPANVDDDEGRFSVVRRWVLDLGRSGVEPLLVALLACTRSALREEIIFGSEDGALEELLGRVAAWLETPSTELAEAARRSIPYPTSVTSRAHAAASVLVRCLESPFVPFGWRLGPAGEPRDQLVRWLERDGALVRREGRSLILDDVGWLWVQVGRTLRAHGLEQRVESIGPCIFATVAVHLLAAHHRDARPVVDLVRAEVVPWALR